MTAATTKISRATERLYQVVKPDLAEDDTSQEEGERMLELYYQVCTCVCAALCGCMVCACVYVYVSVLCM